MKTEVVSHLNYDSMNQHGDMHIHILYDPEDKLSETSLQNCSQLPLHARRAAHQTVLEYRMMFETHQLNCKKIEGNTKIRPYYMH